MNETPEQKDKLTAALLRALETPPQVDVPSDFTARMMARIPQQPKPRHRFADAVITAPSYGRRATIAALVVLLVLMFVFTPAAGRSNTWTNIELVLLVQLSAFVLWLGFGKRYSQ